MASHFSVNVYTPSGIIVKDLLSSEITIPAHKGELNILPGHTHIVTEIATGILSVKTESGSRKFSMTSGILKVLGDKVTILSTTSEKAEQIDIARAQSAKAKAESRLSGKEAMLTDVSRIKFERKLERAKARIKLANLK